MKFIFLFFFSFSLAFSFQGIDTVYSFKPGTGQNLGQDTAYFPKNIFGLPYLEADSLVPANGQEDVLSLGMGGEIILGFKNKVLLDVSGDDFFIYENVLKNPLTDALFKEPAIISVSQDGTNYYTFLYDSLSLDGCAGTKPTLTKGKDYNPYTCGGNGFDFKKLGLDYIKYIKIKDFTEYIAKIPNHPNYDPILSGFDLDAIVGIKLLNDISIVDNDVDKPNLYKISNNKLTFNKNNNIKNISIYSYLGNVLFQSVSSTYEIDLNNLDSNFLIISYFDLVSNSFISFKHIVE